MSVGGGAAQAPAYPLTPAQRLRFDVYGFVLLEGALSADEVADLRRAMRRLSQEADRGRHRIYVNAELPHLLHLGHLIEYDAAFLRYATKPSLVAAAQAVVGGPVRVEETEAIINRRDERLDAAELRRRRVPDGFHTGTEHGWGTFEEGGHLHCLFVKTLAYLTDVGPEDGGTAVIPGSHRIALPVGDVVAAAREDPGLVHQVQARAGTVMLFAESLIHSTTEISSDNERMIVVTGYVPPMLQVWPGNELSSTFVEGLPEPVRGVVAPTAWPWRRRGGR